MESITRKSLLYKSLVEYADYCINHVQGCSHDCKFPCYAENMAKRTGRVKSHQEWCEPKIIENALELLEQEIPRYKHKINYVHLSFMTDPFMYGYPEVTDLTLKIIERLNKDNIRCETLTKGIHPEILIDTERFGKNNSYGVTLVSTASQFKKRSEPHSAPYKDRIESLRKLHDAGLNTWISMEPYPTPNFVTQELDNLLRRIDFVDRIVFGRMNYNPLVTKYLKKDPDYFNRLVNEVEVFCDEKGIDYHIKKGTKTSSLIMRDDVVKGDIFFLGNKYYIGSVDSEIKGFSDTFQAKALRYLTDRVGTKIYETELIEVLESENPIMTLRALRRKLHHSNYFDLIIKNYRHKESYVILENDLDSNPLNDQ
ncbi:radical SAM protein [archaeon]|nr:radical SAM protein [archaeon]MBT6868929.1 radical SAM protein [archaeon]MBT7192850.1 radical SAM protein [archaeon]MBT7380816.1 radical SAM protein [archaeon]MBT7507571.1 radical SAM protein [archaeon]